MSQQETLGIRCSEISQRHRLYGTDVPACDLDFLLIEYDRAEPVALFEYKFYRGGPRLDLDQPSLKAFASLATRSDLPAFVAQYDVGTWQYRLYPANEQAKAFVPRIRWFTEREYATLLYRLRNREIPDTLLGRLNGDPFEEEDEPSEATISPVAPEKSAEHGKTEVDTTPSLPATVPNDTWDEWAWEEEVPCAA